MTLLDGRTFAALEVLATVQECHAHVGYTGFSREGQILLAYGGTRWFRSFRVASRKTIAAYDVPNPDDADDLVPFDDGERLIVARGARIELVSGPSKAVACTADRRGAKTFAIAWDMKEIAGVSAEAATLGTPRPASGSPTCRSGEPPSPPLPPSMAGAASFQRAIGAHRPRSANHSATTCAVRRSPSPERRIGAARGSSPLHGT